MFRRQGKRQGRTYQGNAQDRRHCRNNEHQEPETVTGLAEFRGDFKGPDQDKTETQRSRIPESGRRQGTSGEKTQELENGAG